MTKTSVKVNSNCNICRQTSGDIPAHMRQSTVQDSRHAAGINRNLSHCWNKQYWALVNWRHERARGDHEAIVGQLAVNSAALLLWMILWFRHLSLGAAANAIASWMLALEAPCKLHCVIFANCERDHEGWGWLLYYSNRKTTRDGAGYCIIPTQSSDKSFLVSVAFLVPHNFLSGST